MRKGDDAKLRALVSADGTKRPGHLMQPVYTEMLLQICRSYRALPDPRTLTNSEIRFFYDGMRGELHEITKPITKK